MGDVFSTPYYNDSTALCFPMNTLRFFFSFSDSLDVQLVGNASVCYHFLTVDNTALSSPYTLLEQPWRGQGFSPTPPGR